MRQLAIKNPFNAAPVYWVDEIATTMTEARKIYTKQPISGLVLAAGFQSAGRGRDSSRTWISSAFENVLATLIISQEELPCLPQLLPLLTGLGICHALEHSFGLQPVIKWPNDILVKDKKLCGILCEKDKAVYAVGFGVNYLQTQFPHFPAQQKPESTHERHHTAYPATSVRLETGDIDSWKSIEWFLEELLGGISHALYDMDWKEGIEKRLYKKGENILFVGGGSPEAHKVELCSGKIIGINEDGALILHDSEGEKRVFYAGEFGSLPDNRREVPGRGILA